MFYTSRQRSIYATRTIYTSSATRTRRFPTRGPSWWGEGGQFDPREPPCSDFIEDGHYDITGLQESFSGLIVTGMAIYLPAVQGDSDADGDFDLVDFAAFALCWTGSAGSLSDSQCDVSDTDGDSDVDYDDYRIIHSVFTGP